MVSVEASYPPTTNQTTAFQNKIATNMVQLTELIASRDVIIVKKNRVVYHQYSTITHLYRSGK